MDATVKASFWTDPRVEDSPKEIKLAALWLITNPARDLCGFTCVSNKRFTFETGLDASTLQGACKGLPTSIQGLSGGVYFMRNFLRHQFGKGGSLKLGNKVVTAAVRHAVQLPDELRSAFFEAYPELVSLANEWEEKHPSQQAPSKPLAQNRQGVGEREGAGAEQETSSIPDIVAIYPRRERVTEACQEVARQVARGGDLDAIRAGTLAIAAMIPRLPSGPHNKFVPSALAFFRDERWRDDPQTWLRQCADRNGQPPGRPLSLGGRREAETIKLTKSTH